MKRTFLTVLTSLCTALVFAGGVENKTNMSTGYLRNPSRNTECSRPEAAFYNIAGTAFLEDGLYVEAGNQFIVKEYGNKLDTNNAYQGYGIKDYYSNDETTVFFYPDADIVFKKGRWSTFQYTPEAVPFPTAKELLPQPLCSLVEQVNLRKKL